MTTANPVIQLIPDSKRGLKILNDYLDLNDRESELIRDYPTVYIHNWENSDKYEVYVGESNDFFQRTLQHFDDENKRDAWQKNIKDKDASLYVIAHPEFNKSLTLDVENRLIHYLSSSSSVVKIHNARGNPQNKYYPCEEFDSIFSKIWRELRIYNKALFLSESEIKDSAIYKASPLHKLNLEQTIAKERIIDKITECLLKEKTNQLVFVQGDAGTGKTVLMSSMFYDLINKKEHIVDNSGTVYRDLECAIVVNHVEQLTVYEEIVKKLDLAEKGETIVFNPTSLINLFKDKKNSPKKRDKLFDVIFVDEAHLLLTQNNQSFTDNNQLNELIKYAKVVVVMFDKKQILNSEQYKSDEEINAYINNAKENDSFIELKTQMRMIGNKKVLNWIKSITNEGKIEKLTKHRGSYEIKVFDSPEKLENAIKSKANDKKSSLSRIVATYDWPYSSQSSPNDEKYWNVTIGNWKRPWNREILRYGTKQDNKKVKGLAWAEQPQTINEVGSTYTIQGFDLNYAGVIIGPSIKYRDGRIVYDPSASSNKKATNKRTLSDGTHVSFGKEFLKNELGVLLTRGVNGLYIYACDEQLREVLKENV